MARRLKKSVKTFFLSMIVVFLIAAIGVVAYFALSAPQNDLSDLPDDIEETIESKKFQMIPVK